MDTWKVLYISSASLLPKGGQGPPSVSEVGKLFPDWGLVRTLDPADPNRDRGKSRSLTISPILAVVNILTM